MILDNLRLALELNNGNINQEINIIIGYINQFATNQKIKNYNLDNITNTLSSRVEEVNSDLLYRISVLNTNLSSTINSLADSYGDHKSNNDIHVTLQDKQRWNQNVSYTDGTIKDHAENLTIHVTQEDKDLWNASLQNAKDYAKALFDQLTSFEIVKCQELPEKDIKPMTIYFLQVDPEQDDLYEEYMYLDDNWEKIGNTRIDLSNYVTTSTLQSEITTLNNTINAKETAINQSITNLENKHDQDILTTNQAIETLESNITSTINTIQSSIDNIDTNLNNIHTHNNKDILDNLTQSVIDDSHTHTNKSVLDKFSVDSNENLLYNNEEVIKEFTEADITQLMVYLWPNSSVSNYITIDNKYIYTTDGKIFTAKEGDS